MCFCSEDPDCCDVPGQSEKEITDLLKAIEEEGFLVEAYDIRDIRVIDEFPRVMHLFKEYSYDALPILMVRDGIVAYGIPDIKFILSSIKRSL